MKPCIILRTLISKFTHANLLHLVVRHYHHIRIMRPVNNRGRKVKEGGTRNQNQHEAALRVLVESVVRSLPEVHIHQPQREEYCSKHPSDLNKTADFGWWVGTK